MGPIDVPYDAPNPERLKAAVEMLLEELPDEMKGDFVAFWQQAQVPAEPQPEETINFSIQGIILSPQTQIALLKLNSTSEVQRVRVGETIEGWEITGIENNQISIRKNADTRIIQLVENTANAN